MASKKPSYSLSNLPGHIEARKSVLIARFFWGKKACPWQPRENRSFPKTAQGLRDAIRWYHTCEANKLAGNFPTQADSKSPSQTFEEYAAQFLDDAERDKIRGRRFAPSSIRAYRSNLTNHVFGVIGHTPINELTDSDLKRLRDGLNEGLSTSTVQSIFRAVGSVLTQAVDDELIAKRDRPALPRVWGDDDDQVAPTTIWSLRDVLPLLEVLPEMDRCWWSFAFLTALRRGEICALRWCDVVLEEEGNGLVYPRGAVDQRVGRRPTTKTKKRDPRPVAGVPMPQMLVDIYRKYRQTCELEASIEGKELAPDGLLFHGWGQGYAVWPRRAHRIWREAGVRDRFGRTGKNAVWPTPHKGRHTVVTTITDGGGTLKAAMDTAGHSSAATSQVYTGAYAGPGRERARVMDAAIERARL